MGHHTFGCDTSRKHTKISIFKIPKAKSGMPEHKNGKKIISTCIFLTVCSCHVTYTFQSESPLNSCLNVKELLAQSRREI